MTQEKLTQTLADSLTHTTEHFPSIVIGFLYRLFLFCKVECDYLLPTFHFSRASWSSHGQKSWFRFYLIVAIQYIHTHKYPHTRYNTFCHWSSIQKFDRCSGCGNATHLHFSIFFCCFLKHFYAHSKGWVVGAPASLFACRFVYTYFGICSLSVGLFIYFK